MPHFKVFERLLNDEVARFRAQPLDRTSNIEAQALAKEDAELIIKTILRNVTLLGSPVKERDETFE